MAPEVTTTTRCPAARAWATSPASLSMASVSTRPSAVVTEDEPILTTRVREPAASAISGGGAGSAGWPVNSGWSRYQVKDRSPMCTVSPSRAPALARARSTPRRRSRPWT